MTAVMIWAFTGIRFVFTGVRFGHPYAEGLIYTADQIYLLFQDVGHNLEWDLTHI